MDGAPILHQAPGAGLAPPELREGRLRWRRHLADGGRASVHLYQDAERDGLVAVKLYDSRVLGRRQLDADRFVAEARALSAIRHPHVVPVYAAGHAQGFYWYAMEYAPLGTLSDRMRTDGPAPVPIAARWTFETLLGLEAVHRAGMLHRDIKPSNLLLARDGRVRLADFGLARHPESLVDFRTVSGSSMGSHGYAAPELMEDAKHADGRADLHALTATLYQLLTGRRPGALFFVEVDDQVLAPVPPELRALILRGIATDREQRWPDAAAMADALVRATEGWMRSHGVPGQPRGWMREWPGAERGPLGWLRTLWRSLWRPDVPAW